MHFFKRGTFRKHFAKHQVGRGILLPPIPLDKVSCLKPFMAEAIEFTLNGRPIRAANISPNTTLLEFLRMRGLTGSKEGCAEGDCCACSVVFADRNADGQPCYRSFNSCLVPVCTMAGRDVLSVEGVGRPEGLHPVQRKMVECHGSQCGYCTPGFIMSLFEGHYRDDLRTDDQLDDQLCGNLCRCTGYRPIREAAIKAFAERNKTNGDDFFARSLPNAAVDLARAAYSFANERFLRPTTLAELLAALGKFPDGKLIAGATELGLEITKRYKKFKTLISVEAVPELK